MLELVIIGFLLKIENYSKYRHYIKLKDDDKELKNLYNVLDVLMDSFKRTITLEEYRLSVLTDYPTYTDFLDQIGSTNISEDILSKSVKALVERSQAYTLALLCIDVSEGRKPLSEVLDYYSQIEDKTVISEQDFITDNLEELWEETVHTKGLRWRLNPLNQALGSLRKGDFGFVFARPETGKTTFLASEVSYFAEQTEQPVIWFNNEEQGNKVKVRLYQASLGSNLAQLYHDRPKSHKAYMEKTGGRIKLFDSASANRRQIERIIKEQQPALVIFDQIDKVKGFAADRNDLRLGAIYEWAREVAKEHCAVIGVCQSDVTGEGKKWLTMDNVAESKTTKQGEADWILGIGKTHDIGMEYVRYLHLSKNKLSGDVDSVPEMRHGRMEVIIRPELARYEELK